MRNRWRSLLAVALAVLALAVVCNLIRSQWLPPEPVYQGQPLSYWLPQAIMENLGGVHYNHNHYRDALAEAGPAAIPFILAKLRKSDSAWANEYRKMWPRLPSVFRRVLPQLSPPNYFARDTAAGLMCLGPEAIPALVATLDDGNPALREAAAQALCGLAGGALSTADTARVFGQAIKDSDPAVRVYASFALARIGPAASNSVPDLIAALNSPQTNREPGTTFFVHAAAARALAAIGSAAAPAIPVLSKLLPAADHDTQCVFTNALHTLDVPTPDNNKTGATPTTLVSTASNCDCQILTMPVILTQSAGRTVPSGTTVSLSIGLDANLPPVTSGKLQLWLKADAGVTADPHGRVLRWQDQSGNKNDASQPIVAAQPLMVFPPALTGRPAIRFDGQPVVSRPTASGNYVGVGSYLKGDGLVNVPRAMTSFCVHKLARPSSLLYVLWLVGEPNIWGEIRADDIPNDLIRFTLWAYDYDAGFHVPAGEFRIRTDRLDSGLSHVEMWDTTASGAAKFSFPISHAQTPLPGYFIGGLDPTETFGLNFDGDIAELIIYQGALNDADLEAVNDYLKDKYFPASRLEGDAVQWSFNGSNIDGATNASLVLANAQPSLSGSYSVMVSNASSAVFSDNAVITVKASAR